MQSKIQANRLASTAPLMVRMQLSTMMRPALPNFSSTVPGIVTAVAMRSRASTSTAGSTAAALLSAAASFVVPSCTAPSR